MSKYRHIKGSVNVASTKASHFVLVNKSGQPLTLNWLDFSHNPKTYATVAPEQSTVQNTYDTHTWVVEDAQGHIWRSYQGKSAVLTVRTPRDFDLEPIPDEAAVCSDPRWGQYCAQGNAHGFQVKCFSCVSPDAVRVAEDTIGRMMAECPKPLLQRMQAKRAAVAIIGQDQATHDIPEFRMQRYTVGSAPRGLGGTVGQPVCCVAEENVLMTRRNGHGAESILVHEFAHNVMNIGFDAAMTKEIHRLYAQARQRGTYKPNIYMMKNADEYWAEATQAWFEATVRTDVTDGVRTRWELAGRDPELAALMLRVYGRNQWLYSDTQPGKFTSAPPACARKSLQDVEQRIAERLSAAGSGVAVPAEQSATWSKSGLMAKAQHKLGGKLRKFFSET